MKKFIGVILSLGLVLAFQNCSKTNQFSSAEGDLSATSLSETSSPTVSDYYKPTEITKIQYDVSPGMVPATFLIPQVVISINPTKKAVAVTLSFRHTDGSPACTTVGAFPVDYDMLLSELAGMSFKTATGPMAVDAGSHFISLTLQNKSFHRYLIEGAGSSSGDLVLESGEISKLLEDLAKAPCGVNY